MAQHLRVPLLFQMSHVQFLAPMRVSSQLPGTPTPGTSTSIPSLVSTCSHVAHADIDTDTDTPIKVKPYKRKSFHY